jgi:hypothetical protein
MPPEARLVQISSTHILSEVIDLDAASATNASFLTTDVILSEPETLSSPPAKEIF